MPEKLTLHELKSHLWESANILRGSIDSGDFKNYILGMLFLKRLSDVYDEEYEKLKQTVGEELAKNPDYSFVYCLEGLLTCRIQPNGDLAGCDRVSIGKKPLNIKKDGIMEAFTNLPLRSTK